MTAYHIPTESEKDAFQDLLERYAAYVDEEGGDFTASDLQVLAEHQWPDKNVRVRRPDLGIHEYVYSRPDLAGDAPKPPAVAAGQPAAGGEENADQVPELPERTLHKLAESVKDPRMRAILEKAKPAVVGGLEGSFTYGPDGIISIDGRRPTADELVGAVPAFSLKQQNEMRRAQEGQEATAEGYAGYGTAAWGEQARAGRAGPAGDPLAAVKRRLMGRG